MQYMYKYLTLFMFGLLSINMAAVDDKKIIKSNITRLLLDRQITSRLIEKLIIDKKIKETSDELKRVVAVHKVKWFAIKSMIAKLDVPQPQILVGERLW